VKQNAYLRIFFEALRTAIIFVSGFIIYELLLDVEKVWNKMHPSHKRYHFYKRNYIKFLIIFLVDLVILLIFNRLGFV
jgi:hypothetical protein